METGRIGRLGQIAPSLAMAVQLKETELATTLRLNMVVLSAIPVNWGHLRFSFVILKNAQASILS